MCHKASGLPEITTKSNNYTPNYDLVRITIILFIKRQACRCIIISRLARDFIFTFLFPDSRLDSLWHIAASYRSDLE